MIRTILNEEETKDLYEIIGGLSGAMLQKSALKPQSIQTIYELAGIGRMLEICSDMSEPSEGDILAMAALLELVADIPGKPLWNESVYQKLSAFAKTTARTALSKVMVDTPAMSV